jgi:hypothetical protein
MLVDPAADEFPPPARLLSWIRTARPLGLDRAGSMFHSAVSLAESDPYSLAAHEIARLLNRPACLAHSSV